MRQQQLFLFLCSPHLTSLRDLTDREMHFSDIAPHDITRDLILFNQQRIAEMELSRQLEEKKEELRLLMTDLKLEKRKPILFSIRCYPKKLQTILGKGEPQRQVTFHGLQVIIMLENLVMMVIRN